MENKIKKKNNDLALQNYETLKDELSQILENQRISKKKQDQILETIQRRYELLNYDKKRHLELLTKQGDEFKSKLRTYSLILIDH